MPTPPDSSLHRHIAPASFAVVKNESSWEQVLGRLVTSFSATFIEECANSQSEN